MLDEHVLQEAVRLSGEKTYSAAVNRALRDFVRRIKARRILSLRGSGLWEGDLAEMRGDSSVETGRPSIMVLVDTSAWIEVFRRNEPNSRPYRRFLKNRFSFDPSLHHTVEVV